MKTFWLTFTDGSQGCCQGENEYDAKTIAEKLTSKTVAGGRYRDIDAKRLPYPAMPVIWTFNHPALGACPPFCYTPRECAGKTSCPKSHACSE